MFQSFFDDVVLESDRDKNNIIKDIEDLLAEKAVLEKVSLYTSHALITDIYLKIGC